MMNTKLHSMIEEMNDNMIANGKSDKFIYRTKLLEILGRHL